MVDALQLAALKRIPKADSDGNVWETTRIMMQVGSHTQIEFNQDEVRFPNLWFWKQAASFHARHWPDLVVVLPLLCVPVLSDALHAILIRQERSSAGHIRIYEVLKESISDVPNLLILKLQFWLAASLWSLIPIIGWYKDFQHRINWSMASNVIAFEDLAGTVARRRCVALARSAPPHSAFRTLITIPSLISILCLLVIAFSAFLFDTSLFLWISGMIMLWTIIPWSAAVNTYLYLTLPSDELNAKSPKDTKSATRAFALYCPRCLNYNSSRGLCSRLHFSLAEYPQHFQTECNATYFEKAQRLPSSLPCPNCLTELELEESERVAQVFTCPSCQRTTDWSIDESDLVGR